MAFSIKLHSTRTRRGAGVEPAVTPNTSPQSRKAAKVAKVAKVAKIAKERKGKNRIL
jgi:hypothetical protein